MRLRAKSQAMVQDRWRDLVTQLESVSAAEIVVAVQPRAEQYADVDWMWASLFGLITLVIMVYSPIVFHPHGLVLNVAFSGLLGFWLSRRVALLRRGLTSAGRRQQQLDRSAAVAFEQLQVSHTRDRLGLLLLVSRFECRALVRPDIGLTGRLPGALFHQLQCRLDGCKTQAQLDTAVAEVLQQLAKPLRDKVPRSDEDVNELSDEVRQLA